MFFVWMNNDDGVRVDIITITASTADDELGGFCTAVGRLECWRIASVPPLGIVGTESSKSTHIHRWRTTCADGMI